MFGRLDGDDVASKPVKLSPHFLAWLAVKPPLLGVPGTILGASFCVPFGFDPLQQPLVGSGKTLPNLLSGQPVHIYHQHIARRGREVTPIAVLPDVALKPRHSTQPEAGRLVAGDDEARTMQLDAGGRDSHHGAQWSHTSHVGPH